MSTVQKTYFVLGLVFVTLLMLDYFFVNSPSGYYAQFGSDKAVLWAFAISFIVFACDRFWFQPSVSITRTLVLLFMAIIFFALSYFGFPQNLNVKDMYVYQDLAYVGAVLFVILAIEPRVKRFSIWAPAMTFGLLTLPIIYGLYF